MTIPWDVTKNGCVKLVNEYVEWAHNGASNADSWVSHHTGRKDEVDEVICGFCVLKTAKVNGVLGIIVSNGN
jgi:hypothetical protein